VRVAVLMSGGLDSACAALMLKERGHDVVGITALLEPSASEASTEAVYRARRTCHRLDIPHLTLDRTREFESEVIAPFVDAYMAGETPNPCAACNRYIKTGRLVDFALRAGFERVATGHYCSICDYAGHKVLCEPADIAKSQTYFLALIRPPVLDFLLFPLEGVFKEGIRDRLAANGLFGEERESQDICFAASRKYHEVISERRVPPGPGEVVGVGGDVVGAHRGHHAYTVGQRFGLNGRRFYVIGKSAEENRIVIGSAQQSEKRTVVAREVNWFVPLEALRDSVIKLRYRYNSPAVDAIIKEAGDGTATFVTRESCFAPAPGQVVACYIGDRLVCGGLIHSTA
jgi:tRNA-specific 2-thiouridylase